MRASLASRLYLNTFDQSTNNHSAHARTSAALQEMHKLAKKGANEQLGGRMDV